MDNDRRNSNFKVDFIGIGAFRSGTTWIAQCLREHSEICIPLIKEIEFFAKKKEAGKVLYWNYKKGIEWYQSQFFECKGEKLLGEYSNSYLCDESAPRLIKQHFPNVKLIVCLRNPIDRAYSHYWLDTLNFNANVGISFSHFVSKDSEYVQQSLYYKHLSRYFELFGKEKIHVILFDDVERKPGEVIKNLYKFLEVDSGFNPPSLYQRVNPAARVRFKALAYVFSLRAFLERQGLGVLIDILKKLDLYDGIQRLYVWVNRKETTYPAMREADRKRLQQIFREDIEKLERLIGRDLSAWKG